MRKWLLFICMSLLSLSMFTGCGILSEKVEPGYVGMVAKPSGLTGKVLKPGSYLCFGRDKMILIETKEETKTEKLEVLCADDLNFKFNLNARGRLAQSDPATILALLNRQGANIIWTGDRGVLQLISLYRTYIKPVTGPIARGVVSKYQTTQIRGAREAIIKEIKKQVVIALKGTPVEVTLIAASNFDYPDVITDAMEKKRKREISIQEEKAKQAVELLKADNRLKIAQKMKMVKTAEAQADAAAILIMGKSLTPEYLAWKGIERDMVLYKNVAQGDKVIITNGNTVAPIINSQSVIPVT